MMRNIFYINDMPFSLGYGGKEVQLLGYKNIIDEADKELNIKLLNPWDQFCFPHNSTLHLFGSGKWFHNLLTQATQKKEISKIIISPTFYYDNFWKLKIGKTISKITPLENQFSYKQYIFDQADNLVVNSISEGEQITRIFGKHLEQKLIKIPNTISDSYTDLTDHDCFLTEFGLDPGYVLSVSFLDERKNSIRLIQAFIQAYPAIGRKLVLVGGFRFMNPNNANLVKKLINENKNKIIHVPFLPTGSNLIKSAYSNCSFHVLPSHVETPGIANLEALAFGKNIIVGDCLPVREYFGENAFYIKPMSTSNISSTIIETFTHISNKRARELQLFSKQHYTHQSITSTLIKIYQ